MSASQETDAGAKLDLAPKLSEQLQASIDHVMMSIHEPVVEGVATAHALTALLAVVSPLVKHETARCRRMGRRRDYNPRR